MTRCIECDLEYNEDIHLYCPNCDAAEMLDDGDMPEWTNWIDEVGGYHEVV